MNFTFVCCWCDDDVFIKMRNELISMFGVLKRNQKKEVQQFNYV